MVGPRNRENIAPVTVVTVAQELEANKMHVLSEMAGVGAIALTLPTDPEVGDFVGVFSIRESGFTVVHPDVEVGDDFYLAMGSGAVRTTPNTGTMTSPVTDHERNDFQAVYMGEVTFPVAGKLWVIISMSANFTLA
ncbi:hypothetical protein ES703_62468 [subsurface metagenome]